MSKKTLKVQFTITINKIENIPELCIGHRTTAFWAKGKRAKDRGSWPPFFCKDKSHIIGDAISFTTRVVYDDSKHSFEKKQLKIKIKSDTPKPKLIGKERIDLSNYCDATSEVIKEDSVTLSDKKSETCIVHFQVASKIVIRRKSLESSLSPDDIQSDRLDDTSVSELTEFDDVSTEDDSITSEFITPEPTDEKKRSRRVGRSSTIGPYDHKQKEKLQTKFLDDTGTNLKSSPSKNVRINEGHKEIKQLKDTIAEHEKTIETLKQEIESSKMEVSERYENQIKELNERIHILESKTSSNEVSTRPTWTIGPPSEEYKILQMFILVILLLLCVGGEVHRLLF